MSDLEAGRLSELLKQGTTVEMVGRAAVASATIDASGLTVVLRDGQPVEARALTRFERRTKRVLDVVLSGLALALLLPLLGLVAIAIKLTSRGPVLFLQAREGVGETTFSIMKFRTMATEAGDATGIAQTTADDVRVTGLGRLLRRTSIDELPQLFNVLRGDMSLVGPRPHVPGMLAAGIRYDALVPYYSFRRHAMPGLTGWAQANGYRGATTDWHVAAARVEHDVAYIQNFSLLLDLRILLLTLRNEFLVGSGT